MATPFNVCGGMQDNYDWCGRARCATRRHRRLNSGDDAGRQDGFVAIIDPADLAHRLHRIAGRQHGRNEPRHRRLEELDPAESREGPPAPPANAALPLELGPPMTFHHTDPKVLYTAANNGFQIHGSR